MEPMRVSLQPRLDDLWTEWIMFLEGRGLHCDGGGGPARYEYVVASDAGQATEADRLATREWLAARLDLRAWHVGELEDLNQTV